MSEPTNVVVDDKITLRTIYDELFHCRDFELQHLWQRSVFFFGFLLAIATAYGNFVSKIITENMGSCTDKKAICFNAICLGISIIGIIFSQLWIMMAKGSKRWYEKYEMSISWFYENYTNYEIRNKIFDIDDKNDFWKQLPKFGDLYARKTNDSLLSTSGGNFSVSRINIFVGQFICFVWMLISTFHLFHFLAKIVSSLDKCCIYLISFLCVISFAYISKSIIFMFVNSED